MKMMLILDAARGYNPDIITYEMRVGLGSLKALNI